MSQKPDPLPVRKVGDGLWEVLIIAKDRWLPCYSEDDARIVAAVPVYEYESLERTRSGLEFANELDRLADLLDKYNFGFGSRFFRRRAQEARNQSEVRVVLDNGNHIDDSMS
jgi:hypothetical protein